jgi:hypothetical protein
MTEQESKTLGVGQQVYQVSHVSNATPEMNTWKIGGIDSRGYYSICHLNGTPYWQWVNPVKLEGNEWFVESHKAIERLKTLKLSRFRKELEETEARRDNLLESIYNLEH